jgi:hypothetical protein
VTTSLDTANLLFLESAAEMVPTWDVSSRALRAECAWVYVPLQEVERLARLARRRAIRLSGRIRVCARSSGRHRATRGD